MKKLIIILIFLSLVASAGYYYYFEYMLSPAHVLPEGAVGYININDLPENIEKLSETKIWELLSSIQYERIVPEESWSPTSKALIHFVRGEDLDPRVEFLVEEFFPRSASVAVYPPSKDESIEASTIDSFVNQLFLRMMNNTVFVMKMKKGVKFAEMISGIIERHKFRAPTEIFPYKGTYIRSIYLHDLKMTISMVRIRDYLVVGLDKETIKKSIDAYKKESNSLALDEKYKEMKSSYARAKNIEGYFDIRLFIQSLVKESMGMVAAASTQFGVGKVDEEYLPGDAKNLQLIRNRLTKIEKMSQGLDTLGLEFDKKDPPSLKFNIFYDAQKLSQN